MVKYIIDHIPKDTPCNRRPAFAMSPEGITVHSTGNPTSKARGERNNLTNPTNKRSASFHIVVDENEAIECIPFNENAWHAGDGLHGTGNRKTISIEICESGNREKTIANAIEVIIMLCKRYNWDINVIWQHAKWMNKNCPRILRVGNLWNEFIEKIRLGLEGDSVKKTLEQLAKEVQEKFGLGDGTIQFLLSYIYREDLLKKLLK